MGIVFGFDDDDLEPVDTLERMELVDETLWVAREPSYAVAFFDLHVLDAADPAAAVEAILRTTAGGALRLEQWGYLQPSEDRTGKAIAKLEQERAASPLLRYHYGTGLLLAAIICEPAGHGLIKQSFGKHPALVDVVSFSGRDEISRVLLPT